MKESEIEVLRKYNIDIPSGALRIIAQLMVSPPNWYADLGSKKWLWWDERKRIWVPHLYGPM